MPKFCAIGTLLLSVTIEQGWESLFIHSFCEFFSVVTFFYTPKAAREGPWRSASHHLYIICLIPTLIHKIFSFSNLIWLLLLNCCTIDALFLQSHLLKQLYSSFSTHPRLWNCCTILALPIESEKMDRFCCSRCLNDSLNFPDMIGSFESGATASLVAKKGAKKIIPLFWIKSSQKPQIIKLRKISSKSGSFD